VSGGIHGANRMGATLSRGLVFGVLGAHSAVEYADSESRSGDFQDCAERSSQKVQPFKRRKSDSSDVPLLMRELKDILWKKVGIVRNEMSLSVGLKKIDDILERLSTQRSVIPVICTESWSALRCHDEQAVAVSALERTESRGAHFRDDFPEENNQWLKQHSCEDGRRNPRVSRIIPIQM